MKPRTDEEVLADVVREFQLGLCVSQSTQYTRDMLRALVARAEAAERAACAKVADRWGESVSCNSHDDNPCCHVRTGANVAAAIRDRSTP